MEEEVRTGEPYGAYEVARPSIDNIVLPPEFTWLRWLTEAEQRAFFQSLIDILAQAWTHLSTTQLSKEVDRWREQAQKRKATITQTEHRGFWETHAQRLDKQRQLIDEMLQDGHGDLMALPSTSEVRELLGHCLPYADSLSDEIIAIRYEEQ